MTASASRADDRRHDLLTRRASVWLSVLAAAGSAIALGTQVLGWVRTFAEHGGTGVTAVVYLAVALGLTLTGLAARTPNVRRRSLWVAAILLLPPAVYLSPIWWLGGPLIVACLTAGAAAFLIGHRQRCRRV